MSTGSKIDPEPFFPFLFLVFLVVEAIEFSRPVGDVGFELAGIFEEVHGKEFLSEVTPVEFDVEDGFVEVLELPEGKLLGQEAKAEGVFLNPFLKPYVAGIEDLPVVEGHFGEGGYTVPVQFVCQDLQLMVFDIDQGAIGDGDDAGGGVAAGFAKGFYLFEVDIIHACTFPEDAIGRLIEVFVVVDEVSQQAPFVVVLLEVGFDEQDFQFVVVETKNDAVHGYPDNTFALQLFQDGLDIFLRVGAVFGQNVFVR